MSHKARSHTRTRNKARKRLNKRRRNQGIRVVRQDREPSTIDNTRP